MRKRRRRTSIRFWQTALFVTVIVVAILILSASLSAGLRDTLTETGQNAEARNASALARKLEPDLPLTPESRSRAERTLTDYRAIYGTGIWVYDRDGTLSISSFDTGPSESALQAAHQAALAEAAPIAVMDLRAGGWAIASRPILDENGWREGVVVTAGSVADSLRILDSARDRLWVSFWISLGIAGLIGFAFSEIIRRRVHAMLEAADRIAAGDFEQHLPTGLIPDEIQDLALAYNRMAERLGEAFRAIQESEREITAVVESMAEGVVAFGAAGTVRVANPEAVRLLGLGEREMIGSTVEELTTNAEMLDVVHAGLAGNSTARIVHEGGFTVLLNCTTLFSADGTLDGAVLLLTDVTEQRRIEAAQRRFVADASHELRTPVAALKGMLELLVDGAQNDPEVREDFIRTMQVEADRLGRLVGDLLTLAQFDAGSLRLSREPAVAAALLGDVARVMSGLAERAGVTLTVEPPADGVRVLADRDRVVQVLLCFTDNAIKHSGPGATVRLSGRLTKDGVLFEVADEGPGIAADDLSRLFERFYRAEDARPAGSGGAGLGLAIAKEIVEAHGSRIDVRSEPGSGTVFGFELPTA